MYVCIYMFACVCLQETPKYRDRPRQYRGKCFVTKDNIDTDQIIPAEFLTLVPSKVTTPTITALVVLVIIVLL